MSELVSITAADGVSVVRMNTPQWINALSLDMREALIHALTQCFESSECKAVVLTGSGGNFSSGGDLKSARPEPEAVARTLRFRIGRLHELVRMIRNSPKPVVAAVQGKAYGAGLSLAAACDTVVIDDTAEFSASFGKVGLIADAGLLFTLPRRVGAARAQNMLLGARTVGAEEALRIGLADSLATTDDAIEFASGEALRLGRIAPLAFAATKSLLNGGCNTLESAFEEELRMQPMLAMTQDNAEARRAFAERRPPLFRGC